MRPALTPTHEVQTQPAPPNTTWRKHSLACGFPATPAMACWPICICPMAPMPPTGAPVGRGPMPMAPWPPVRLVRAFMGSSRRVDNRQYYAAPTCTAEIMNTMSLVVTGPAETEHSKQRPNRVHVPGPPSVFLSVKRTHQVIRTSPVRSPHSSFSVYCHTHGCL